MITNRSTDGGTTWTAPGHRPRGHGHRGPGQELDRLRQHADQPVLRPLLRRMGRQRQRQPVPDEHLHRRRPDLGAGARPAEPRHRYRRPTGGAAQRDRHRADRQRDETRDPRFRSTDGGKSWSQRCHFAAHPDHDVAGNLRTAPLPSAEIDARRQGLRGVAGLPLPAPNCAANDIVMTTSTRRHQLVAGATHPDRPAPAAACDHFIPGLAVDRTTGGRTAPGSP